MQLPYLLIPIRLPGIEVEGQEPAPDKTVTARIQPAEVGMYHEGYAWGTMIYTDKGVIMSTWNIDEYEANVQSYWEQMKALATKSKIKLFQ